MLDTTATGLLPFPFGSPPGDTFAPLNAADLADLDAPVARVVLPTGERAWLITRHADVRQMLREPAFSADLGRPGFPLLRPIPPQTEQNRLGGFIRMDGEEHQRLRRMLTAEFMIKNIRRIEPLIERTVVDALASMRAAGPPADLIGAFALPVPSMVICHLLGVPYADHEFFQQRSRTLLDRNSTVEAVQAAIEELRGYLRALVDARTRSAEPGDDLLGRLIVERVATGELDEAELAGMALLLLIAGHETTANMIGLSTLVLLRHPESLAALRAEPKLAGGLVEELLRFLTIVRTGLPRIAAADVEIGGQLIRAGEGAIALLSMANRDSGVFDNPDEFDMYREAHQHIAFGFGVHQCIGQPLARAELRIALVELARRFPGLHTTVAPDQAPLRPGALILGLAELPVSW
jgi:cytochrome P450